MLQDVDVGRLSIQTYRGVVPDDVLEAVEEAARALRGVRVLHVNATPYGGGVSELLRSLVPALRGLGLATDWQIISGDAAFFEVTKQIHNALQGDPAGVSPAQWLHYEETARQNAAAMQGGYDVVVVHDPQPAALPTFRGRDSAKWIWRCHIDTSAPEQGAWRQLREYVTAYDAAVFTMADFVPADMPVPRVEIIPPAIDPSSPKNMPLSESIARDVLNWIGIDVDIPLVTQVSRFDPWKDPLGVIRAYRIARSSVPGLQLAMVGSMALDDPQGWEVYRQIQTEVAGDPLIHMFTNLTGVGNIEVNAFQAMSEVVVQKSIREGFGLVVSEAMWKGTPVVAGRAGGIPLQAADGAGAVLVDSIQECAGAIVDLLEHPQRARDLGARGRQRVRDHFLLPRLVLNELGLIRELLSAAPRGAMPEVRRDPVCGIVITAPTGITTARGGRDVEFCSARCRSEFDRATDRYPGAR